MSKAGSSHSMVLKPDLFFIAEGAHSSTAEKLGMHKKIVDSVCSDENWGFGNVPYEGNETFVVSVVDTSDEPLEIANVIFNAKAKVINVAVTLERVDTTKDEIKQAIVLVLNKVLMHEKLAKLRVSTDDIKGVVKQAVKIINAKRYVFAANHLLCIGDTAGHSSPLAGLGGTICLTFVPVIIDNFLKDIENNSANAIENANAFSNAVVERWFSKSIKVKEIILSLSSFALSKAPTQLQEDKLADEHDAIMSMGRHS